MEAAQQQDKGVRWGELDDDDGGGLDFLLPPRVVIGPDEDGIKKTIEYGFDDDGNTVRVTTTTRLRKIASTRVSKNAIERRSWAKFGDAANEDDSSARLTMVSTEEIFLERPRALGSKADESSGDPLGLTGKGLGGSPMVCRACGKKGEHWTSKCPYKDIAAFADVMSPTSDGPPAPPSGPATANNRGAYVPPRPRDGAATDLPGHDMRLGRNDENSVRVTNLSEDAREDDLHELFARFGPVSRVYVAVDKVTRESKGFGFVHFVHREDAETAIAKLNGYGYDNLILRVEWAAPRPPN